MSEVEELRAEVERLRKTANLWFDRAEAAEARLRKVEALADEYAANGAAREAAGLPAWPNNVARDIRAALAAEPVEEAQALPTPETSEAGSIEATPPAEQRHPSLCICTDCDAADAAKRTEGGASAGGADNECSCAMTEASQRTCPLHGEDDWRADTSEQGGEPR